MLQDTVFPLRNGRNCFSHPDVAECAVVGIDDELKGQIPFATVVLKTDHLFLKIR
jgi:acyl-coenzyme A synthetase/AMP-(fatty) acid ligase